MSYSPGPLIEVAIEAKTVADQDKLASALATLASQDEALRVSLDKESGQTILGGVTERQLEQAVHRLLNEFAVDVRIGAPHVAYRESLTRAVEIDYTHAKIFDRPGELAGVKTQLGSSRHIGGQFARVKILFEPLPFGAGYRFENATVGGAVPVEFIPGVEKGLDASRQSGVIAGFPLLDFKATLIDGAFHEVDSTARTFEIATRAAFRQLKAHKVVALLEPVMKIEVTGAR